MMDGIGTGYWMEAIWKPQGTGAAGAVESIGAAGAVGAVREPQAVEGARGLGGAAGTQESKETQETKETQKAECQTCKERKYMDQSNEGDVSFQAPTHIAPGQAAAKVMSHEKEHVQNAVSEGQKKNKRLVSVSVSLKTGVCPECGRTYIAGGTTRTKMLTYKDNPYDQGRKSVEGTVLRGMNVDQRA